MYYTVSASAKGQAREAYLFIIRAPHRYICLLLTSFQPVTTECVHLGMSHCASQRDGAYLAGYISHSAQPRLKYIFHLEYGNHVCRIIIIIIIIIAESSALVVCFFGASVIRKPAAEEALCSSGFVRKAKGEPFLCRAARRIFCVLLSAH